MNPLLDRLCYVFLRSETVAVRAFFGILSFAYGLYIPHTIYFAEYGSALLWMPAWLWALLFHAHSAALWFGIFTRKFNAVMLALEGVLGVFVWVALGLATTMAQGIPGPTLAATPVAIWILVRYPTWK